MTIPPPLSFAVAIMLLIGALPIPWYDYYTLLRIVGCSVFAFAAFIAFRRRRLALAIVFALLAIAFNPFIKVHFPTEVWNTVDIVAAILLLLSAKFLARKS